MIKLRELYKGFDKAHNTDHRDQVVAKAVALAEVYAPEYMELVVVAATLHDVGLVGGRDGHEQRGAKMAVEHYAHRSQDWQDILFEAIAQHRASSGNPEHVVAKIVSDADRISSASTVMALQRAFDYHDGCTPEERMAEALRHLDEKYAPGAYGRRCYFNQTARQLDLVYAPIITMSKECAVNQALAMIGY